MPGTAKWERTLWKKLEVGDVVLLRDDEQVPADIVSRCDRLYLQASSSFVPP